MKTNEDVQKSTQPLQEQMNGLQKIASRCTNGGRIHV